MHVRAEGCPKDVLSTQLWTASAEQRTADTYNMQVLLYYHRFLPKASHLCSVGKKE